MVEPLRSHEKGRTPADEAELHIFAEQGVPKCVVGLKQGCTTSVSHGAAQELNVLLKPVNQLPHNRDKPSRT